MQVHTKDKSTPNVRKWVQKWKRMADKTWTNDLILVLSTYLFKSSLENAEKKYVFTTFLIDSSKLWYGQLFNSYFNLSKKKLWFE